MTHPDRTQIAWENGPDARKQGLTTACTVRQRIKGVVQPVHVARRRAAQHRAM